MTHSAGHRAGEGLPSSRRHPRYVPRPIRRGVPHGCASRLYTASMAFAPISRGSALPCPARRRMSNDAAGFASCYGPHRRSPIRASDAGLRPRPFPGDTASLLPGLLAATRTGLPPAGDDELTNTKKHHGTTSRCHLPFCWAHEKTSVGRSAQRFDVSGYYHGGRLASEGSRPTDLVHSSLITSSSQAVAAATCVGDSCRIAAI